MPKPTYACTKCDGTNVEIVCWVDANTGQVTDDFGSFNQLDTQWCRDCEENVTLAIREDNRPEGPRKARRT